MTVDGADEPLCEQLREYIAKELEFERLIEKTDQDEASLLDLFRVCVQSFDLYKVLKLEFGRLNSLQLDGTLEEAAKRIRSNEIPRVIEHYQRIAQLWNEANPGQPLKANFADHFRAHPDALFEHFRGWFDIPDYYLRRIEIGPLFVAPSRYELTRSYFDEIRECYALKQHRACIALCRAMIEYVLKNSLRDRGQDAELRITDIETGRARDAGLQRIIRRARHLGIIQEGTEVLSVKNMADQVLHAFNYRAFAAAVGDSHALDAIRKAVVVVELICR